MIIIDEMPNLKDLIDKMDSVKGLMNTCDSSNIEIPQQYIQAPLVDDKLKESMQEIYKSNIEKFKRDLENNQNLKTIVEYNEQISNYNKELVNLNEKILSKINSLDDTLLFLNDTFKNNSEFDKGNQIDQTALLLQLIKIMDEKDEDNLKKIINKVGAPVAVGLIVQYLKMKIGI